MQLDRRWGSFLPEYEAVSHKIEFGHEEWCFAIFSGIEQSRWRVLVPTGPMKIAGGARPTGGPHPPVGKPIRPSALAGRMNGGANLMRPAEAKLDSSSFRWVCFASRSFPRLPSCGPPARTENSYFTENSEEPSTVITLVSWNERCESAASGVWCDEGGDGEANAPVPQIHPLRFMTPMKHCVIFLRC